MNKTFSAVTKRDAIIPAQRRVELQDVGHGSFLIVKAETDKGVLRSTNPLTLFLVAGDFDRVETNSQRARRVIAERSVR